MFRTLVQNTKKKGTTLELNKQSIPRKQPEDPLVVEDHPGEGAELPVGGPGKGPVPASWGPSKAVGQEDH